MLGGLGKELRRCGVDTVILENDREHTDVARVCPVKLLNKYLAYLIRTLFVCLKIARHENRYAFSSGLPFYAVR